MRMDAAKTSSLAGWAMLAVSVTAWLGAATHNLPNRVGFRGDPEQGQPPEEITRQEDKPQVSVGSKPSPMPMEETESGPLRLQDQEFEDLIVQAGLEDGAAIPVGGSPGGAGRLARVIIDSDVKRKALKAYILKNKNGFRTFFLESFSKSGPRYPDDFRWDCAKEMILTQDPDYFSWGKAVCLDLGLSRFLNLLEKSFESNDYPNPFTRVLVELSGTASDVPEGLPSRLLKGPGAGRQEFGLALLEKWPILLRGIGEGLKTFVEGASIAQLNHFALIVPENPTQEDVPLLEVVGITARKLGEAAFGKKQSVESASAKNKPTIVLFISGVGYGIKGFVLPGGLVITPNLSGAGIGMRTSLEVDLKQQADSGQVSAKVMPCSDKTFSLLKIDEIIGRIPSGQVSDSIPSNGDTVFFHTEEGTLAPIGLVTARDPQRKTIQLNAQAGAGNLVAGSPVVDKKGEFLGFVTSQSGRQVEVRYSASFGMAVGDLRRSSPVRSNQENGNRFSQRPMTNVRASGFDRLVVYFSRIHSFDQKTCVSEMVQTLEELSQTGKTHVANQICNSEGFSADFLAEIMPCLIESPSMTILGTGDYRATRDWFLRTGANRKIYDKYLKTQNYNQLMDLLDQTETATERGFMGLILMDEFITGLLMTPDPKTKMAMKEKLKKITILPVNRYRAFHGGAEKLLANLR